MTAPLRGPPHSQLAAAAAAQTAPVAEFRCLYTPDVRKKQKKWHDGFLKFHAFNSRVMVYDQARNFLGDTYCKDRAELREGDELTLDKGVMVDVAEAVGVTQTDLKPLFDKKPKDAPPPPSAPARRFQPPSHLARPQPAPSTTAARAAAQQLRHKSLNTLLGTPKGPIGKSVPIKSPYEARQERQTGKENDFAVARAAKRQKTTHRSPSAATLRLSSPAQDASPAPKERQLPQPKPSITTSTRKPARPTPPGATVITLDELDAVAHVSSSPSLPSTPPAAFEAASMPVVTPAQPVGPAAATKPAMQTPKLPRGKVPVPSVKASETPRAPALPSSPPVSASNRLTNIDFAIQPTPAKPPIRQLSKPSSPPQPAPASLSPPRNPKAKSLRLSRGVKRGTLMICQPPPALPRSRESSGAQSAANDSNTVRHSKDHRRHSSALAVVSATGSTSSSLKAPNPRRKAAAEVGHAMKRARRAGAESLDDFDDDPEVIHGLMDQQLLTSGTPPPEPIPVRDSPKDVLPRPRTARVAAYNTRILRLHNADGPGIVNTASSAVQVPLVAEPANRLAERPQAAREPSPPAVKRAGAAKTQSRAASPALSAASDSRSRTESPSPRKLAALSTGGFRKRTNRVTPQPGLPAPDRPPAVPRNESVALPPHPLRANKKGPVMTTTELAATLQKSKKKSKASADPIEEDGGDAAGTSPNRKFRRVRSENDAPIPSTSEDWERRNLPKATAAPADVDPVTSVAASERAAESAAVVARKKSGLAALIKKTDPRKKFVRTQSLTVETTIPPAQDAESPMASPVLDTDIGPWSTEAFDLFDWRPPGRENLGA
ncbi:hypothetical protein SVAN01_10846 [Stagonosporopsis vannaccii]|nr:hypothetical protein SVAN01_10846 [Stagonosporopsis vannaccii]